MRLTSKPKSDAYVAGGFAALAALLGILSLAINDSTGIGSWLTTLGCAAMAAWLFWLGYKTPPSTNT